MRLDTPQTAASRLDPFLSSSATSCIAACCGPGTADLSLDRTAAWLTGAGRAAMAPARSVDPAPFLVTLPGAGTPVTVVGPPGRVGDHAAGWVATTELGADTAAFATA